MELRKLARANRRGFRKSEGGVLAQTILGAMKIRDQMKTQGLSREELDRYMEGVVRTAWPRQRAEPWHYLCDRCRDTGLEIVECSTTHRCDGISTRVDHWREKPGKYQRLCVRDPTYTHDYGVPCPCPRGERFRASLEQAQRTDIASLGRKKSNARLSRFGE
jgi:hypothetical protein